jgi:hypothetical protein
MNVSRQQGLGDARAFEGGDDHGRHRIAIDGDESDAVLDRRINQRHGSVV